VSLDCGLESECWSLDAALKREASMVFGDGFAYMD
jgi:hypothetical protein